MEVNISDILTLDNDEKYVVCSKVIYDNKSYLYIINLNNNLDFKILTYLKNSKKLINVDEDMIQILLPLLYEEGIKNFNNLNNNE